MRHRGQLLIIVLWVMGLVSLAVGSLTVRSTHELRLSRIPLEELERKAIAQAAVRQAIALVVRDPDAQVDHVQEPWATGFEADQPALTDIVVGEGMFRIGIAPDGGEFSSGLIDEERKLNLNTVQPTAFARLIEALGVAGTLSPQQLADALVDWRNPESGPWCDEQQLGYPCHNAALQSVEELLLVPGMTAALFAALAPYVTVYGHGLVNANTASVTVLNALGCPGDAIMERRTNPFTSTPADCPGTTVMSSAFTVPVEAWLPSSSVRTHLAAVIHRDGRILAWAPNNSD